MNPKYPIYIVSKSRWESRITAKSLEKINVPYFIVVEKSQYNDYCSVIDPKKVLILDQKYLDEYDTFDDLGFQKSKGPGAARNFAWEHSMKNGHEWHWVMDDNLSDFYRWNNNKRIRIGDGTMFRVAEQFVERYENIAISGLNYRFFCPSDSQIGPYTLNTRIYSCLLIRNDIPYRWRGRYNEDTDICLRVLKDGWCTLQFNAFLCGKIVTQALKGGNTEAFYAKDGTFNKSQMLVDMHPDVSVLTEKYGRIHHYVDYRRFKKNALKRKPDYDYSGVNEYGMKLKYIGS